MGRLLFFLGIVVLIVAVGYLIIMIMGIENEMISPAMESLLCEDNENFSRTLGAYGYNPSSQSYGRSVSFYCVDSEGFERDVSLGAVLVIGGGFTVLLLVGIAFFFMAGRRFKQNVVGQFQNFSIQTGQSNVLDMRDGSYQSGEIPPETMEKLQQVMGQFGAILGAEKETLTERLQQLEEARDKGLISESEYRQVRQTILDSMDD